MDSRKLERILILVLLLLNGFLLAVVLSDSAQTRRSNAETEAALAALLEENGLSVAESAVRVRSAPPKCTLTRDMAQEQRLVSRLIGKGETFDQGGFIFFYNGKTGQAMLRGSGEMDVIFSGGSVPLRGGAERTALRLMRRVGVGAVSAERSGPDSDSAELYCTVDGFPVYNAVLHFGFSLGSLNMLSGTRVFDSVSKEADAGLLDSVSVLLRFVELVRDEGYICSRIETVTPGYLQTVTRSGETELAPVWRIETDAGAFLIDAESGRAVNRLS